MAKLPSHMLQLARRGAAFRLRQLLDGLHLLIDSLPDARDAFEADELPLAFILKRDSRRNEPAVEPLKPISAPARNTISRRMAAHVAARRDGHRKADEGDGK